MNDISINYALRIVIQAKNGTMTAIYNSKFPKSNTHTLSLSLASTPFLSDSPLLARRPLQLKLVARGMLRSIGAWFEGFMANLSDTIKYTLLTQNHITRTHAYYRNWPNRLSSNSNARRVAWFRGWAKLLIIPIVFTKTENQMTYKRIIHKHYNL